MLRAPRRARVTQSLRRQLATGQRDAAVFARTQRRIDKRVCSCEATGKAVVDMPGLQVAL